MISDDRMEGAHPETWAPIVLSARSRRPVAPLDTGCQIGILGVSS